MEIVGLALLVLLWTLVAMCIGLYARNNGLRFWKIFLVSFFFTPIAGIIVVWWDASEKRYLEQLSIKMQNLPGYHAYWHLMGERLTKSLPFDRVVPKYFSLTPEQEEELGAELAHDPDFWKFCELATDFGIYGDISEPSAGSLEALFSYASFFVGKLGVRAALKLKPNYENLTETMAREDSIQNPDECLIYRPAKNPD